MGGDWDGKLAIDSQAGEVGEARPAGEQLRIMSRFVPTRLLARFLHDGVADRLDEHKPRRDEHGELQSTPITRSTNFDAALLFTDVSGFTALTERLGKEEGVDRGAETLNSILNAYFDLMISTIDAHGGDVIKFAGDALLSIWPAPKGEDCAAEALACAACADVLMHGDQKLNDYNVVLPSGYTSRLKLHVGMAAGNVWGVVVGVAGKRTEYVIAGQAVDDMGDAEGQAANGEVVVSGPACDLIEEHCGLGKQRKKRCCQLLTVKHQPALAEQSERRQCLDQISAFPPRALESTSELLRPFVPGAVRKFVASGDINFSAEFREVSMLFIRLHGLDYGKESFVRKFGAAVELVQRVVFRYEGSLSRVSMDDKGICVKCTFGLPPLCHEDDGARGVQTGLLLCEKLRGMQLGASVGAATGPVFIGTVGSSVRAEYTEYGNKVNLSARLMSAAAKADAAEADSARFEEVAGGSVYCDTETQKNADKFLSINWKELPAMKMKGQQKRVPVFVALGAQAKEVAHRAKVQRSQSSYDSSHKLLGHAAELSTLCARVKSLKEGGKGGCCTLSGDPGVGKTRLVSECVVKVSDRLRKPLLLPSQIWRCSCRALDQQNDGIALVELLEQALDLAVCAELRDREAKVLRYLPKNLKDWAYLLNSSFECDFAQGAKAKKASKWVKVAKKKEATVALLLALVAANAPVMIAVEDVQWLDSASWGTLEMLLRRDQKRMGRDLVLLLLTHRPIEESDLTPEFAVIRNMAGTEHVHVSNFTQLGTAALIKQVLEDSKDLEHVEVSERLATLVHERSGGNALFVAELVRRLIDPEVDALQITEGALHKGDNYIASLKPGIDTNDKVLFPSSLRDMVVSRVDKLSQGEQMAMKVASVIRQTFSIAMLSELEETDPQSGVSSNRLMFAGMLGLGNANRGALRDALQEIMSLLVKKGFLDEIPLGDATSGGSAAGPKRGRMLSMAGMLGETRNLKGMVQSDSDTRKAELRQRISEITVEMRQLQPKEDKQRIKALLQQKRELTESLDDDGSSAKLTASVRCQSSRRSGRGPRGRNLTRQGKVLSELASEAESDEQQETCLYKVKDQAVLEVVYSSLMFNARKQLHQAVGEWQEQLISAHELDELDHSMASLHPGMARHFHLAGDDLKAVDYYLSSADWAIRELDMVNAIDWIDKAFDINRESPLNLLHDEKPKFLLAKARAHMAIGESAPAQVSAEACLRELKSPMPERAQDIAKHTKKEIATAHKTGGCCCFGGAEKKQKKAIQLQMRQSMTAGSWDGGTQYYVDPEKLMIAASYSLIGEVGYFSGAGGMQQLAAIKAYNVLNPLGMSNELLVATSTAATVFAMMGDRRKAMELHAREAEMAASLNEPPSCMVLSLTMRGQYHVVDGEWAEAFEEFSKAAVLAEQYHDKRRWEESTLMVAYVSCCQGKFAAADDAFRNALRSATEREDRQMASRLMVGIATCLMHKDQADNAIEMLERHFAVHKYELKKMKQVAVGGGGTFRRLSTVARESANDWPTQIHASGLLALAYQQLNQPKLALVPLLRALNAMENVSTPTQPATYFGYVAVAEAIVALANETDVANIASMKSMNLNLPKLWAKAEDALAVFAATFAGARPDLALLRGMWLRSRGKGSGAQAQASRLLQEAAQQAEEMGMAATRGRALALLAVGDSKKKKAGKKKKKGGGGKSKYAPVQTHE